MKRNFNQIKSNEKSKARTYLCIAEPTQPYLSILSLSEPTYLHLPYLFAFQKDIFFKHLQK